MTRRDPDTTFIRWMVAAILVMLAVIALGLVMLRLESRQLRSVEEGRPLAPHRVGHTPTTYGPPPA